ncbi:hypothetical protein H310_00718 [Aphanomyces invadans]|uniref:Cyclic nucleotide-binding domain-containing protein n=1 Tax=Aphanomyces invadans TaxID=157072 RepID=A0A024UWT2_9STRA|nr:hypothetical protein H310_00718 [Aphanomyces invadans]ETW10405.1 hypothetical protein H310_00718 [Aphanomyces invadans]|eukprot:XP_008861816.1 hypothetical protein H310_00718 [Aphanomyces invadans]
MVLSFRTGFVCSGEVEMDPQVVSRHYIRSWFVVDLVSNLPFRFVLTSATANPKSIKFLKLQKIPKLLRFTRLLKYMRQYAKYYQFVLTLCVMAVSLHSFSCIWVYVYFLCDHDIPPTDPMCDQATLDIGPIYLEALTNVVLLYIGSGQQSTYRIITPVLATPDARASASSYLLSLGIMILGISTMSVLFGNILSIIISWDQQSASFRNRMDVISAEMRHYDLPMDLQRRVRRNYDYLWLNQRAYSEMSILNQPGISQPTRTNIALHLYRDLIESVPYFAGEDSKFLGRVCLALKTAVYLPDDTIIQQGDTGREMFFVRRGLVHVEVPGGPPHIQLKDGDFFGETALVVDVRRTNTVRAVTICDLNVLSKHAFDDILAEFPDFFEKIKRVVIQRQLNNMHIKSPKDKAIIEAELTDVVNETAKRRIHDTTSPYWRVLNAKRVGNKLKNISERVRLAQERNPRLSTVIYRPRGRMSRRSAVPRRQVSKRSIVRPDSIRRILEALEVPPEERRVIVDAVVRLTNGIPDDTTALEEGGSSAAPQPDIPIDDNINHTQHETIQQVPGGHDERRQTTKAAHAVLEARSESEDMPSTTQDADNDGRCSVSRAMTNQLMLEQLSNRLAVVEQSAKCLPKFLETFDDAMAGVARDLRLLKDQHGTTLFNAPKAEN